MSTLRDQNPYASPGSIREDPAARKRIGRFDRLREQLSMIVAVSTTCVIGLIVLSAGISRWESDAKTICVGGGMVSGALLTLLLKAAQDSR
jgi:hypothetical protein